jgi:ribonuclease VapC
MVVDTSALVAISFEEPEAAEFTAALHDAASPKISSATLAGRDVHRRRGPNPGRDNAAILLAFLDAVGAETVAVDRRQAVLVNEAFLAFGKGRHKARLNYGDCFSYALAKSLDLPLLFKGDDFRHTYIRPAL